MMTLTSLLLAALGLPFVAGILTGLYSAAEARIDGIRERIAIERARDRRLAVNLVDLPPGNVHSAPPETPAPTANRVEVFDGPSPAPWEQVNPEPGREACNVPCTAKHCAEHAGVRGCYGQRHQAEVDEHHRAILAWTTDTAEWDVSLLGLAVPDFPPVDDVFEQCDVMSEPSVGEIQRAERFKVAEAMRRAAIATEHSLSVDAAGVALDGEAVSYLLGGVATLRHFADRLESIPADIAIGIPRGVGHEPVG